MTVRRWFILATVVAQLTGVALAGAAARPSGPSPTIALVQLSLRVLSYDPGPIDGLIGQHTATALTAYARDRRIVLNQATTELVVTLLAAEASEALRHVEPTQEPLRAPRPGMLSVYEW
jgi:peptidoglycan hydrolase-like protein with peptidoglycan-binding domain